MKKIFPHQTNIKNTFMFNLVAGFLCFVIISIFPIEYIKSQESADNPNGCPYYISLQSVLANYPLNAYDKANAQFIKQRLLQFEHDIINLPKTSPASHYRQLYFLGLNKVGLTSITQTKDENHIILAAMNTMKPIDDYYLDKKLFCSNPLYTWRATDSRRILLYNLSALYDQLPNKFMRILVAEPSGYQLGVFSGFFVNTQSTTLVTQFMTGQPLLTALYVQPKYDFFHVGNYQSLVPWCYFQLELVIDPFYRKLFNIAGIDVFTVTEKDLAKYNLSTLSGTTSLKSNIRPEFSLGFKSYINTQSYGMAYLANKITAENPQVIKKSEAIIKHYFARPNHHHPIAFRNITNQLYDKLMRLEGKHDIVLESDSSLDLININNHNRTAGQVVVKGIVGERATFTSDCQREKCLLVFNTAYAHGWHAFVNGVNSKIYRANFAFMATPIPHGTSTIWFIYSPLPNLLSYFLSIISLLIILFFCMKKN